MRKYIKTMLIIIAAFSVLASCRTSDEPEATGTPPADDESPAVLETFEFTSDTFPRIDGCPSTIPMARALAAVMLGLPYEETVGKALFTGSTQAFYSLSEGLCDIILTGEPSPAALDDITRQDFRYDKAPIATDALVFIVSKSNPVNNLTSDQIKSIYSGELTGWQQAGGNDIDIIAYQRNEDATGQVLMEKLVMDWSAMAEPPMQPIEQLSMFEDSAAKTAVKGFDGSVNAIGYTLYYYAVNMNMADDYKILSVDGVTPSAETISDGTYPYTNPYYACINKDLPEDDSARILYNWLQSDAGQSFISTQGYVSIKNTAPRDGITYQPPPAMRWDVITADIDLPLYSCRTHHTRLRDAALPSLEPAGNYGRILPYSASVTLNDGGIYPVKYGFVTSSGVVITDPVYDGISRAAGFAPSGTIYPPAFSLHINLPDNDSDTGYRPLIAACASDGSWITPFLYSNVIFREDVILLMYTDESFDIDVYDYRGNLLYNVTDLDWAERISDNIWPEYLLYSINEGYGFIELDDGLLALMDIKTGSIRETGFTGAYMFADGLAAVRINDSGGLWGFVDYDLNTVLPAAYAYESLFINGRAIVETPDGTQSIIDKSGEILYSADPGHRISTAGSYNYLIFPPDMAGSNHPSYLTFDFNEIKYPSEVLPLDSESSVSHIISDNDIWILCTTESSSWIFNYAEKHKLPSPLQFISNYYRTANGNYILYVEYDADYSYPNAGFMSVDGTVIVPPGPRQRVRPVYINDNQLLIAINKGSYQPGISYTGAAFDDTFMVSQYILSDTSGYVIKNDLGTLTYDEMHNMFFVQGSDYCAWLSADGSVYISIPSMAYSFD